MESKGCEFISGQRGMGKTSYVKEEILPIESRCLVYDHMAEFTNIRGYSYFNDWDKLCDFIKRNANGLCRAVYIPVEASPEEFDLVCRLPFATKGLTLVTDEIDQYATATSIPIEFKRLIHFGRHYGSRFIGCSRRPADVARAFTSQAYRFVCFRQSEPRDIAYLKSFCGDRAEEIQNLEPLHYLLFEQNKPPVEGKLSFAPNGKQPEEEEGEDYQPEEKDVGQNGEVDR